MSAPGQAGGSASLGPPVPSTALEKYSLLLVRQEEISRLSSFSSGNSGVFPSGNWERKVTVQKVQYSNVFLSSQSFWHMCALVIEVMSLSCQPGMPQMEEMWHTADCVHTHSHTQNRNPSAMEISECQQRQFGGVLGLHGPEVRMCNTTWLQATGRTAVLKAEGETVNLQRYLTDSELWSGCFCLWGQRG